MRFTFLHAADLHLGAASQGVRKDAPEAVRKKLDTCTYEAYENLIALAIRERVAFAVFSGDQYHAQDGNLKARLAFARGIERLGEAGIRSYVIYGNHDPYTKAHSLKLHPLCTVFDAAKVRDAEMVIGGDKLAHVYGISHGRAKLAENLSKQFPRVMPGEDGLVQVALLHGNDGGLEHENTAPFSADDLRDRGYDYWALGHVHTHRFVCQDVTTAVYTGALQGTSPRETGPKGCVLVDCAEGRVEGIRFKALDTLRWASRAVSLDDVEREEDLFERLEEAVEQLSLESDPLSTVARITLRGPTQLDKELRQQAFLNDTLDHVREVAMSTSPWTWVELLEVATETPIDWASVREQGDSTCQGYVIHACEHVDAELLRQAKENLKDLFGTRDTKDWLPLLTDDELQEMLLRAGKHAISMLNS